jgi:hypothetical protein
MPENRTDTTEEFRPTDWPSRRSYEAAGATEPANPASNPGPRGNEDVDERDFDRACERFAQVL